MLIAKQSKTAQLVAEVALWAAMLCLGIAVGCQTVKPASNNVAEQFLKDYAINLSGAFIKAASEVEQQAIKTDADLLAALKTETEYARKEAAKSIDQYLEANLSNGELKPADVQVLRDLGQQFRRAYGGR